MKAITTKYLGPTDTRGSRIRASDSDGNAVTIGYPHELSGEDVHRAAAEALAKKMGWTGTLVGGAVKGGYVFVFSAEGEQLRALAREVVLWASTPGDHGGNPYRLPMVKLANAVVLKEGAA